MTFWPTLSKINNQKDEKNVRQDEENKLKDFHGNKNTTTSFYLDK